MSFREGMTRALALVVLLAATACSGSEQTGSARTALEEFTSQHPGAPVVVPVRWSDDWAWFEPDMWQSDNNGRVTEVYFRITPTDMAGRPSIGLCAASPEAGPAVTAAHADEEQDVVRPCDMPDAVVTRTVDGLKTVIFTDGDEWPPEFWSDVELTTQWRAVDWLDDVPGGCCTPDAGQSRVGR